MHTANTIVWSPCYYQKSAGIRALHILCAELRKRGVNATIRTFVGEWSASPFDAPKCPSITYQQALSYSHIYPESISDICKKIPIENDKTYMWILAPRLPLYGLDHPQLFWDNYLFRESQPTLSVNIIDSCFMPRFSRSNRSGIAVYEGKGKIDEDAVTTIIRSLHLEKEPIIRITKKNFNGPPSDIAAILQQVRYTVTFDSNTCMIPESLLCDTPVYLAVPEQLFKTRLSLCGVTSDLELLPEISSKFAYHRWGEYCKLFDKEIDALATRLLS